MKALAINTTVWDTELEMQIIKIEPVYLLRPLDSVTNIAGVMYTQKLVMFS